MNELVKRQTISEIVEAYDVAVDEIEGAYDVLDVAEKRLNVAFTDRIGFRVLPEKYYYSPTEAKQVVLQSLKMSAWRALVDLTQIKRVMSVAKAGELDNMLRGESKNMPDITLETVMATMQAWAGNIGGFMDEAVKEVFDMLAYNARHDYKTNDVFRIGRKVVLTWMVEQKWGGGFRVRYGGPEREISALNNVFRLLDGAGASQSHHGELYDAIHAAESGVGETTYFKFRCYKNSNLHLEFKRMDLVEKINAIGGDGHSLRRAS